MHPFVFALVAGCQGSGSDDSTATDLDSDGFTAPDDCNDADGAVHPGADEHCNGADDDCDGAIDDTPIDTIAVFVDADADGYGGEKAGMVCAASEGEATVGGDCDDAHPAINPDATEICNTGIDDDCNGLADDEEGVASTDYYVDVDEDGFGGGDAIPSCDPDPGLIAVGGDCDDTDAAIHPGATEFCNGIDDDCEAATPETGMIAVGSDPYWTIQDAVDDASPGDTVLICDGTFYDNVVVSRSMILQGMGADVSVIDGGGGGAVVAVDGNGIHLTVRGLTLQNGTGDASGSSYTRGGAIQAIDADSLTVEDCVVADNTATYGGGVYGPYYAPTFLRNSTFRGNTATDRGGGAYVFITSVGDVTVEGCEFLDNTAAGLGGGLAVISLKYSHGDLIITDTLIDGNTTTYDVNGDYGGGLYADDVGDITLTGVTISNNESAIGGGLYTTWTEVVADDKTVLSGNTTHGDGLGGGAYCACEWTGGRFESNTATMGGGLVVTGSGFLDGATVEGNHATELGGGVLMGPYTEILNSVITANTSDVVGGGIATTVDDDVFDFPTSVADSTITANVASESGGGAYVQMTFESSNSDWGEKATENDPDDVTLVPDDGDVRSYDEFGAAEDFVCNLDPGRCR